MTGNCLTINIKYHSHDKDGLLFLSRYLLSYFVMNKFNYSEIYYFSLGNTGKDASPVSKSWTGSPIARIIFQLNCQCHFSLSIDYCDNELLWAIERNSIKALFQLCLTGVCNHQICFKIKDL